MPVVIPLYATNRGPYRVNYYRTKLDVRMTAGGRWHPVRCVIDTARDFTLVPTSVLGARMTVPPLPRSEQIPGLGRDYLGSLFFRFPASEWRPTPTTIFEYHCSECVVGSKPRHAVHLAMRDLLPNFTVAFGPSREMILTPSVIHAGFPSTP